MPNYIITVQKEKNMEAIVASIKKIEGAVVQQALDAIHIIIASLTPEALEKVTPLSGIISVEPEGRKSIL